MKIGVVSPVDIKHSFTGTDWHEYEYVKYLLQKRIDAKILVTNTKISRSKPAYNNQAYKNYKNIPTEKVKCTELLLPFKWHLFVHWNLPKDRIIYLPFSVYDYILNIITRPHNQKYIIGNHGMHLKYGHIVMNHNMIENALNSFIRYLLLLRSYDIDKVYYHVLNKGQVAYLTDLGVRKENIFYVPAMVDIALYRMQGNRSKKLRILHIGGTGKGGNTIVEIIDELIMTNRLGDFEFCFIGAGVPQKAYEYAKRYSNVIVEGIVSENRKIRLLSEYDAMIVPFFEVFPKAMLEGLASGLYVLTSLKNGAAKDMEDSGVKLTVVETDSIKEYVDPLLELAGRKRKDPLNFNKSKISNRKIIEKEFDKRVILRKMLKMFEEIGSR